jgi:hypothetical protein
MFLRASLSGHSTCYSSKRFFCLNIKKEVSEREKAKKWYYKNRDEIAMKYWKKAILVEDGKVLKAFDNPFSAEAYLIHAPNAFMTIVGDENFDKRVHLENPLVLSSEIPPQLTESPISLQNFQSKSQFYGYFRTPWILLPVRHNPDSKLVYPVWFYPDTGSHNTYLEESTREALQLENKEGILYLFDNQYMFNYHASEDVQQNLCKGINLLGRNVLYRGTFVMKMRDKRLEFYDFGNPIPEI